MRRVRSAVAVIAMAAGGVAVSARMEPATDVVVSAGWLAQHRGDRDVVIVQVGRRADYDKEHIGGSRLIEPGNLDGDTDGTMNTNMLPTEASLRRKLEALGISDNSHVVVVSGAKGVAATTRVLFLVRYAGLERASLLDGGLDAWKRAGLPVTREVPVVAAGQVTAPVQSALAADYAYVQAHLKSPGNRIIDARTPDYYSGPAPEGTMGGGMRMAAGHIPGAANLPYNTLVDNQGLLLPRDAIEARFRAAGVQPGDTVIAYCHVGMQATVVVLGARLIGNPVRLYAGSFHDWSAHKLPTEGGK